jgi:hypothetical protein
LWSSLAFLDKLTNKSIMGWSSSLDRRNKMCTRAFYDETFGKQYQYVENKAERR